MVTPTFAAGLGVIVAATLAATMTKTVLHFSSPVPGQECAAGPCGQHGGSLASAHPGVLITTTPGHPQSAGSGAGGSRLRGGAAGHPVISYQLAQQWPGGFTARITIAGLPAGTWRLAFGYPGVRILGVQGARWQPSGAGSGVVEGDASPSPDGYGQATFMVSAEGEGPGRRPASCTLNGAPCTFASPGDGQYGHGHFGGPDSGGPDSGAGHGGGSAGH